MPVFVYRAADRRGQTIDGVMEAPDARAVIERLQRDAYFPIRVPSQPERARGGVLEITLRRLAEFIEARAAFADAVRTAIAYPIFLVAVGIGAIVFLMTFVIPRFATIFSDLGQTMPLPTQILLWVSAGVQGYWWAGVLLILGALLGWRVWTGTPQGRGRWDQTMLGLPLVGPLFMKIETARFARTLGAMR